MYDKTYTRPIAPIVLSLMAGISVGTRFAGMVTVSIIGLAGIAAFIVYFLLRRKYTRLLPILAFFLLGYLSIQPWIAPRFPSHHVVHFAGSQKWRITGTITSQPKVRGNRYAFFLAGEYIESKDRRLPVTGRIRVTAIADGMDIRRGDRIVFESRLRSVRNFYNPGGFDYERYLAFEKVWVTAYCQQKSLTVLAGEPRSAIYGLIERVRHRVYGLIDGLPPGDHRAVLAALILGDRSRLTAQRTETFHRVGIGHLLAISGLHIGIVASTVFILLSRSLAWLPWFLWTASSRKWAAAAALPPVLMYALLSGMSPSTQRALVMVGVFMLTFLIERDQDLLNSLCVAALALLVIHPPVLFSISFQFSFAAVLAIIAGMGCSRLNKGLGPVSIARRVGNNTLALFLVSLWATIGTVPLAMYYFNQVSLIGILANGIFVPLIGFGVVPSCLLAVAILPISQQAAETVLQMAAGIVEWSLSLVDMLSALSFAAIRTVTPSLIEIVCYGLIAWVVVKIGLTYQSAAHSVPEGNEERLSEITDNGHDIRRLWIVLAVLLAALSADVCYWTYQRFWRQDLRTTVFDVGQGSAVLLELPGGTSMLIDGGGYSDNAVFDVGARVIAPFLWRKKIRTVETIVLTHPNSDHLNGLLFIAENFNVQAVLTNGDASNTSGFRNFLRILNEKGIVLSAYEQVDRIIDRNGVKFEILYPPTDFQNRKHMDRWRNVNNNSIVIKATHGKISFLFPGDITAKAEEELVAYAGERVKSTVLVIPHHGSVSSSTPGFVRAVQPLVGIVSAGWQNRYKFPHPEVIDRYRERQTRLLRTDTDGAISLTSDGRRLSICTFTNGCD